MREVRAGLPRNSVLTVQGIQSHRTSFCSSTIGSISVTGTKRSVMLQRNGSFAIYRRVTANWNCPESQSLPYMCCNCFVDCRCGRQSLLRRLPRTACNAIVSLGFGQALRNSSDRLRNATKGGSHCSNNAQCDPRSNTRPKEKHDHNCLERGVLLDGSRQRHPSLVAHIGVTKVDRDCVELDV